MSFVRCFFFFASLGVLSLAQASICQEAQRRIGAEKNFQNFSPEIAETPLVRFQKSDLAGEYITTSGEQSGIIKMKDYGLFCTFKSLTQDAYFSQEQTWALSIPNRKGECWVYAALISRLVPDENLGQFIRGGFCVSPVSANPDVSWSGTSAFLPVSDK